MNRRRPISFWHYNIQTQLVPAALRNWSNALLPASFVDLYLIDAGRRYVTSTRQPR
jgi:hypothetical protein